MPDEFAVVTFQTPTSTGTLEVTSPDITDFSAAIIFISGATADATTTDHVVSGLGFVAGTTQGASAVHRERSAVTAANGIRRTFASSVNPVNIPNPTNNTQTLVEGELDGTYTGTTGFRLDFTKVDSTAYRCVAVLFGGLDGADLRTFSGSTGGASVSGLAFQPDVLINTSARTFSGSSPTSGTSDILASMGFVNANQQASISAFWDFGTTSAAMLSRPTLGGGVLASSSSDESIDYTITSDGYTGTSSAGTPDAIVLALKFSEARSTDIRVETFAASTGTQSFANAGFPPELVLAFSSRLTSNAIQVSTLASSYGFHAMRLQGSASLTSSTQADQLSTNSDTRIDESKPFVLLDDGGGISASADTFTPDAAGFDLDFQTADDPGRFVMLAIERLDIVTEVRETVQVTEEVRPIKGLPARAVSETVEVSEQDNVLFVFGVPEAGSATPAQRSSRLVVSRAGLYKGTVASPGAEYREN